jgi:hypothetical protein
MSLKRANTTCPYVQMERLFRDWRWIVTYVRRGRELLRYDELDSQHQPFVK